MMTGTIAVRGRQRHRLASSSLAAPAQMQLPSVELVESTASSSADGSTSSSTHPSDSGSLIVKDVPQMSESSELMFVTDVNSTDHLVEDRQPLYGPGGAVLRSRSVIRRLLPDDSASIYCLTWNIAAQTPTSLDDVRSLLHPPNVQPQQPLSDLVCIALQELPTTNMCFHVDMVTLIGDVIGTDHVCYCWFRKWTQMLMLFVRRSLVPFITDLQWNFVACGTFAKPMRTKGAIGMCFRLFQSSILVLGCHLSYSSLSRRLNDIRKISAAMRFDGVTRSSNRCAVDVADVVIWFGDLNFRLNNETAISTRISSKSNTIDWNRCLMNDQLSIAMKSEPILCNFTEQSIGFAPTYKFVPGTSDFDRRRVPAYTDRIIYRNNSTANDGIIPVLYSSVPTQLNSDHKPVYAVFRLRVVKSDG